MNEFKWAQSKSQIGLDRQSYLLGFADGAESVSRWIDCNKQMPLHNMKGLVLGEDGKVFCTEKHRKKPFAITHWMPFPLPPESDK